MVTIDREPVVANAELVADVMRFHGHTCPGAAVGIRVAEAALGAVGSHSRSNQIVAVVETNLCAVDPVQYLTGCTFGKRNLIHLDHGKNVFTFWQRSTDAGVRIVVQPDSAEATDPDYWSIHERIHEGTATDAEQSAFQEIQEARYHNIMGMDLDRLCYIQPAGEPPPRRNATLGPRPCTACGELTLGSYLRVAGQQELCAGCLARSVDREVSQT